MAHIQWKDRYNINYKEIDTQHRVLLDLLNELIDIIDGGGSPHQVSSIFQRLCAYALNHFSREERYMKAAEYPGLAQQESEHVTFVHQLLAFDQAYDPSDPRLLEETSNFLKTWYLDHILRSDMGYVPFLKRYWREATPRAVIFDFGNVLCAFDNHRFLEGLGSLCGKTPADLNVILYEQSTITQEYEAGRCSSQAFREEVSRLCGTDFTEEAFIRAYTDIFTPIQASFELIRKLKSRYKVGLLSDTSPWHFHYAIQTTEVFSLFDSVTLSYEVGAAKPDVRLFEDALSKLDLLAEECIYVDDRPAFAKAATDHLLHGITFTTPVALMAQLRQHQVQL